MTHLLKLSVVFFNLYFISCQSDNNDSKAISAAKVKPIFLTIETNPNPIKYLALGDSYTIGQSVCETCRFPEQLKNSLFQLNTQNKFELRIIAQTGWTTTNLISGILNQNPTSDYDLVTLLIGVNNQYQQNDFTIFEKEFPELVEKSIALGKNDKSNVIVISIPDYAYTPFANGNKSISPEIDKYNSFISNYCSKNNIQYADITAITRKGLLDPSLVAEDRLHPSAKAYTLFVERILPKAVNTLQN